MEQQNKYDIAKGFKLYRKGDDWIEPTPEGFMEEDVEAIVTSLKQNIDQGYSITLGDLMPSYLGGYVTGSYGDDWGYGDWYKQLKKEEREERKARTEARQKRYEEKREDPQKKVADVSRTKPKITTVPFEGFSPSSPRYIYTAEKDYNDIYLLLQLIEKKYKITIHRDDTLIPDLARLIRHKKIGEAKIYSPITLHDVDRQIKYIEKVD